MENAQCDSATMTVQCHVMVVDLYVVTSPRRLAMLPHHPQVSSQPHWHFCTVALAHGFVRITSMQMLQGRTTACKAENTALVGAPNCMQRRHAVQCNTHAERFCSAMAEWVMFETDLWNGDSLSHAYFFRFRNCINTGVQQDSFPAPVP